MPNIIHSLSQAFDVYNGKIHILFLKSKNPRKILAEASTYFYKKKPKNLIAVTGTNGKTSVSNFFLQIMLLNNKKAAAIGTLGVNSKKIDYNLSNTSINKMQNIIDEQVNL